MFFTDMAQQTTTAVFLWSSFWRLAWYSWCDGVGGKCTLKDLLDQRVSGLSPVAFHMFFCSLLWELPGHLLPAVRKKAT